MFYIWLITLLGIAFLVLIINLPIHPALKIGLGIAGMYGISKLLASKLKIKDEMGMLFLRTQAGISIIEKLAKNQQAWKIFADIGCVLAYGLASFFVIKRSLKEKAGIMLVGFFLLTLLAGAVIPFVFPFLMSTLKMESIATKSAISNQSIVALGMLYIGGLALIVFASLLAYTAVILSAAISTFFFGTSKLASTSPGATLILPGVNIPFLEGVIALVIILIVHEGAHAILSRVARIRILSSGIVFFGILPIGAFVEPDEEQLKRMNAEKQTHVLIAGSTANLLTSIVAFVLFIAFIYGTASYREIGLFVASGNLSGSVIYKINGQDATTFLKTADNHTKYNSTLFFETDKGNYEMRINPGELKYYDLSSSQFIIKYKEDALQFVYTLLGLIFSLNFVIGAVNLLPLPFFDGYRLLEINVNSKMAITVISWIAAIAFAINFLPWLI